MKNMYFHGLFGIAFLLTGCVPTIEIVTSTETSINISGGTTQEGNFSNNSLAFIVNLNKASDTEVSVNYTTGDLTAVAGEDYTASSGTITFAAGETQKSITVPIIADNELEADETFSLTLNNVVGAALTSTTATGTIVDDEIIALQIDANIKKLKLSWPILAGADFYRLSENIDGTSGFTPITGAEALTVNSYSHNIATHLYNWESASYIVEACNADRCISSSIINASALLLKAIGYIKAPNTDQNDSFGYVVSVSDDGSTLAVGAWGEDSNASNINGDDQNDAMSRAGAVYIYSNATGEWLYSAYIKPDLPRAGDRFGYSVNLSADGNTLAVGAYLQPSNYTGITAATPGADISLTDAGAAYIFVRSSDTWSQQSFIKPSTVSGDEQFGFDVALSGDGNTLAVGMPIEDGSSTSVGGIVDIAAADSGAVYIFTRSGTTWSEDEYIKPFNTRTTEQFGKIVSLNSDGTVLAVASDEEKSNGVGINGGDETDASMTRAGAAYIFRKTTGWAQEAYIKASNTGDIDRFGKSMDISSDGNTLAIGAYYEDSGVAGVSNTPPTVGTDDNTLLESGAAYIFFFDGTNWGQQAYIKASNPGLDDQFGRSISVSGDGTVVAVGSYREDSSSFGINSNQNVEGKYDSGAVYIYSRNETSWSQSTYLKAPNSGPLDLFGTSVSLDSSGTTLAVGAEEERSKNSGVYPGDHAMGGDDTTSGSGAVYLF